MKSLIVIYTLVVISGLTAVTYANSVINSLAVQPVEPTPVSLYQLQGGGEVLQASKYTVQGSSVELQASSTSADELQPAAGYQALTWKLQ